MVSTAMRPIGDDGMEDYVLKPYELIICKVPNDHAWDAPAKPRPVVILDPAYDESDFEDDDFSLKDVFPIFLHGTSQIDKYKDRDDFVYFDEEELKDTKLRKPTGFIVSDVRLAKNEAKEFSAYDILHDDSFQSLGVLPDELKNKLKDFIRERDVNVVLYESFGHGEDALSERINDFIEDLYDLRKESIASEGEYGLGNLVFKEFRNLGYLDNLKELRKHAKSKELSLEKLEEDTNDETENEKLFWNLRDDSNSVAVALLDLHNGNNIWYNKTTDKIEPVPEEVLSNRFAVTCEQTRDDVMMTKDELLKFKDEVDGIEMMFFDDKDNIWGGEYSVVTANESKAKEACVKYGQDGYAFFDEKGNYSGTKDKDGNIID